MISRAEYIQAALERARRWTDDHPYAGPPLVEEAPAREARPPCARHGDVGRAANRLCLECDRERKQKRPAGRKK